MKKKGFVTVLYTTRMGQKILNGILHSNVLCLAAVFMRSKLSRFLIQPYIRNNNIDMSAFEGVKYDNFSEFFSRKRPASYPLPKAEEGDLISPCDGLLSAFPIDDHSRFFIKQSWYRISDLIPNPKAEEDFKGGTCLIFRLQATDYHRYVFPDDAFVGRNHYIEGLLHSVQPAACDKVMVYKHNRRVWTLMKTKHFGKIAQIEVGALLVGGIVNHHENKNVHRGEEMGYFDLAGSTIVLLLPKDAVTLYPEYRYAYKKGVELPVRQGEPIGHCQTFARINTII